MSFDYVTEKISFSKCIESDNASLEQIQNNMIIHIASLCQRKQCTEKVSSMVLVMGTHVKFPHVVNE